MNKEQEQFLNDTLVMAGFDPEIDDFEMLKEEMRPILDEYLRLNLYKFLNEEQKAEYNQLDVQDIEFFKDKVSNFDNILAELYKKWQKTYLGYMMEDDETSDEVSDEEADSVENIAA